MPKAKVNGITLNYEVEGSGPPLLLIMGLGGSRLAWTLTRPLLTDTFTVITFDNRGTGQSDVPPGPYTMDQMGDDCAALIDHLGLGPVNAVGLSLGGSVLQSVLINHGDKLNRAVLLSTLPSYTDVQHHWLDALLALRKLDLSPQVLGTIGLPWAFTPRLLLDHAKTKAAIDMAALDPEPTGYEGFAAQAQAIREYDSRPDLHKVTTPTLVLVGAEDVLTPPSQAIEMFERIPNAQLKVLPRGGHVMVFEYPEDTLAEIVAFVTAPELARVG